MRQINLLPPEIAKRRRAREIMLLIGAAGLALIAVLVLVFLVQTARVAGERGNLEDVKKKNAALQGKVDELARFAQIEQAVQTKEQLLTRLTLNEVRWSVLLNDISLVIPSDVWLTGFTGAVRPAATTGAQANASFGTIALTGSTFTHLDVAKWISRLDLVREFRFPYLTLSNQTGEAPQEIVMFNSSVELSSAALRRNQPGGERNP